MKLYITGPMTGLPEFNHPAFYAAAKTLSDRGFTAVNPAENGLTAGAPWAQHMRRDIAMLVDCDGLATLPGCATSIGAQLEIHCYPQWTSHPGPFSTPGDR